MVQIYSQAFERNPMVQIDKSPHNQPEGKEGIVIRMDRITDPRDSLTPTDIMAFMLLQGFIKDGYPALDPVKQVDAAYSYAELMTKRRKS